MLSEHKYFSKKGKLNDVVIIRSLAIVMVVAFHAYYMMMVEGHFPKSMNMYKSIYWNINNLILQFRMPLFITISGYLFSHLENDRGKYASFHELFKNKFKRLIIPFFVFSSIFMVSVHDFRWDTYYRWGYQHLWFIPMLFWCFIITRVQSFLPFSHQNWWKLVVLTVFFYLSLLPEITTPLLGIQYFIGRYYWFYFGYQLYLNRDYIYGFLNRRKWIYSMGLMAAFIIGSWFKCTEIKDNTVHTWYTELANTAIVILFWFWINYMLIKETITNGTLNHFNWLNKHAYGIYVFHNWLQPFMISNTAIAMFGLDTLALEYPVLFPLAFFLSSFVLSLGLTWMLLRTRVGRFLIG